MRKILSKPKSVFYFILIFSFFQSQSQNIDQRFLNEAWDASWIQVPGGTAKDYGVYYFRKSFYREDLKSSFLVHVTADNRYKLFVNGKLVSLGPARSDLFYWNYETVDIAPFLQKGKNTLAAVVWNEAGARPEGQISNQTGFLLQADDKADGFVNTDTSWKGFCNHAYQPLSGIGYPVYYVAGPGEKLDMNQSVQNWSATDFDDQDWKHATQIGWGGAMPKGVGDINGWMLVPSPLPQMELKAQRFQVVKKSTGIDIPMGFPSTKNPITIPSNTHAVILLDQTFLTNAYPTLIFSKGKNTEIAIRYAEALFNGDPAHNPLSKGNRNEVAGKFFAGRKDSIISDGSNEQSFTTLSWRTFRYIELTINTKEDPITINDFYNTFCGYPFTLNATLETADPELKKIFEIGWRTARSCAMETYMDCPFYEQLQYIGDTRIQSLISLYNSGDDRLVRNAINQIDHSRMAEGITLSRHPSFSPQQIPTFSLWYIGMLHDYWMYHSDRNFVADKLQGTRNVLWFFNKYQQKDGTLKNVPYWMFTDWVEGHKGWEGGTAPYGKDGSSSILDLQLLWALQLASEMETKLGSADIGNRYKAQALKLQLSIRKKYWDAGKKMFADSDDKALFSQHANTLAILTNCVSGTDANHLAKKILEDPSLAPASIYFKYYLHMACVKAGLGNEYLNWLDIWRENIKMGLTTWAEISNLDAARSDCHAWGASPNIEFFRTVLGIDTDAPGFSKVKIEPHLGSITDIGGSIPHPKGKLSVSYKKENGKWKIEIIIPKETSGTFLWKNKKYELKTGPNQFVI